MWPFNRKSKPVETTPALPKPESHKRITTWADRMNNSLTTYEEMRERVVAEIDDKREELRQIDAVLTALRAGLATFIDDPSLPFMTAQSARSHLEALPPASMNELDDALGLANYQDMAEVRTAANSTPFPSQPHRYEART